MMEQWTGPKQITQENKQLIDKNVAVINFLTNNNAKFYKINEIFAKNIKEFQQFYHLTDNMGKKWSLWTSTSPNFCKKQSSQFEKAMQGHTLPTQTKQIINKMLLQQIQFAKLNLEKPNTHPENQHIIRLNNTSFNMMLGISGVYRSKL